MDLKVDREELLRSLHITLGVVERRTTMPMLSKVLIEASGSHVRVTATDMEIGVKRTFAAEIKDGGTAVVDARKIYEVTREISTSEVRLTGGGGGEVEIHAGTGNFKLPGGDVSEFPGIPVGPPAGKEPSSVVKIASNVMDDVIDKTIFAAAEDDSRIQLRGVYAETPSTGRLRMVATDGHRMAMLERDVEGGGLSPGVILPRKGLMELKRLIADDVVEVAISVTPSLARVECGAAELSMRLVEGKFPDYQQVIKKEGKRSFAAERDSFFAALKRVAIVSNDVAKGVRFQLKEGNLTLLAQSSQHGEACEEIEVEYGGDEFSIGFNAHYMLQVLAVLPSGGKVSLSLTDQSSACLVRCDMDGDYTYVVMPLRQ